MIPFDQIGTFITKEEANNLRILDASGNKILDIQEASPANAINTLISYGQMLSGYGKITIKGTDDAGLKSHFTNSAMWKVYFPNVATATGWQHGPQTPAAPAVGMNKEYMAVAIELERLKERTSFDQKFRELEEKLTKKSQLPIPMEYLPFVGQLMGWSDEKMFKLLQMSGMASNLNGLGKMVTDNANSKLTIQGTDEEKVKMLETVMPEIWEGKDTAWKDKFLTLLSAIKKSPDFVNQAYQFVAASAPASAAGLAGPPAAAVGRIETTFSILQNVAYDDEKF